VTYTTGSGFLGDDSIAGLDVPVVASVRVDVGALLQDLSSLGQVADVCVDDAEEEEAADNEEFLSE
jgi:hypothetical protein